MPNRRATDLSPLAAHSPKRTGLLVLKNALSPRLRLLFACLMALALNRGCGFKHDPSESAWAPIGPWGRLGASGAVWAGASPPGAWPGLAFWGALLGELEGLGGYRERGEMESWELVPQGDHTAPSGI